MSEINKKRDLNISGGSSNSKKSEVRQSKENLIKVDIKKKPEVKELISVKNEKK